MTDITLQLPRPPRRRRRPEKTGLPYASASSGTGAREEITKILRRLGCEEIGFMDKYETHELLLHFKHRGRTVQLTASARGWAQKYLKENPYSYRSRKSKQEYDQDSLRQGQVAVNSILRDWVKGQVTAVECGILSFEAVFMPYMLTGDGQPLLERMRDQLPPPAEQKIVALPPSRSA